MRWSLATIVLVPRGTTLHANSEERQRVLEWAAAAGFEGLEISPHWLDVTGLSDRELAVFRTEVSAAGLRVSGINVNRCLFTRGDRAAGNLSLLYRAIEAAAALAAPIVTLSLSLPLGGPSRSTLRGLDASEAERQQAAEGVARLAEATARCSVELSLELHDDGLLDTPELCLDMIRRVELINGVSAAKIGVNPDLGNLIRSCPQANWRAALASLAPKANNWHVKNYRDGGPSPVWVGDIDYAAALDIMRSAGYDGWVGIESYFGDVLALQTQSLNYLKRLAAASRPPAIEQGSAA